MTVPLWPFPHAPKRAFPVNNSGVVFCDCVPQAFPSLSSDRDLETNGSQYSVSGPTLSCE